MASNKKDLKAYVRYDGTGRIVPSSVILQRFKPKDGNWQEVQAYECCDPSCRVPVYGQDWIVLGTEEIYGGIIFNIAINPSTVPVAQFQMVDCLTGNGIGDIITVDINTEYEYAWFVPDVILNESCTLQIRQVCGFNYTSAWNFNIGG